MAAGSTIFRRYLPIVCVIVLGVIVVHTFRRHGPKVSTLEPGKDADLTIDAEFIKGTDAPKPNSKKKTKPKSTSDADKISDPTTTDILDTLPETSTSVAEFFDQDDNKVETTPKPNSANKGGMEGIKNTLAKLMKADKTDQNKNVDMAATSNQPTVKEPTVIVASETKVAPSEPSSKEPSTGNALSSKSSSPNLASTAKPKITTPKPAQVNSKLDQQLAVTPVIPRNDRLMIDARLTGVNTTIATLEVTYSHAEDPNMKKYDEFKLDALTPFIHNVTNKWLCNQDGSCYENWLDMTFPPNADHYDQRYKSPCYTEYMTGNFRCIPHVHLVGWAKSGTTDMWWFWSKHPDLVHSFYKETQFLTQFSFYENHKTMKKYDDLLRYFFDERSRDKQERHPEKIMYDCTATTIYDNWHWKIKQGYLGDQNVPTFTNFHYLRKLHPAAQIVVLMRNPTTRALSFYNHGIDMTMRDNANLGFKYAKVPTSAQEIHQFFVMSIYHFEQCMNTKSLRACCHMAGWESQNWADPQYFMTLRIGIYYVYLEEVYKNFDPKQVHLIKSEEYYGDTTSTLNKLFTFMNISTSHTGDLVKWKGSTVLMNIKKYLKPLPETYSLLQKFYAPFNIRLSQMLKDSKWLDWEAELDKYTQHNG